MYLFAPAAFAMKVTALHLWSIFTPKSGANAKEREGRMHFGVAQGFAALIAGVRQMSLKLSAKAAAGLPRRVRGYAGLWRGIALQGQGACSFLLRDCLAVSGGMQVCSADPEGQGDTDLWRMVSDVGVSCYVPRAARSFAFGELAHIEALVFCVQASVGQRDSLSGSWRTSRRLRLRPSSARVEHPGSAAGLSRSVRGYAGL